MGKRKGSPPPPEGSYKQITQAGAKYKPKDGIEVNYSSVFPESNNGATYTIEQAWDRVGRKNITKQALYLAAQRGDFLSIRLGRRILIPKHAFEQFLLGGQQGSESAA
jgi:hypothetical protein